MGILNKIFEYKFFNKLRNTANHSLIYGALIIPLNSQTDWTLLKYRKIPANKVVFNQSGLNIEINSSASPIIYPLKSITDVSKISVNGLVSGKIKIPAEEVQGSKKADDYALRIGLVVEGKKTLGFGKRLIAPSWVKTLFDLAPKGTGVKYIYFVNATQDKNQLGKSRTHFLSEYIKEDFKWLLTFDEKNQANFNFNATFKKPMKVLALWISVDGDQTKSKYKTLIKNIKLN